LFIEQSTMEMSAGPQSFYALGHSEQELQRLTRQGQAFEPFTRQLFQEAGISKGMRILDVGCGSGDVTFLAADLVGRSGEVVGVDRERKAVDWAEARARSRGIRNVNFVEGDPAEMQFDRQFDAVVGRLVLMYYPDPVDTVRKLMRHVRTEGLSVFQEIDLANACSLPVAPLFERSMAWIKQTLSGTGARLQMGLELYPVFLAAGLPGPSMRVDALIGGGPQCPLFEVVAELVQSLLPVMEKLNIASGAEAQVSTLAERIRDEVVALNGIVRSAGFIGAWSRKRDSD
jgi:2-polyprenyl-3-methyl-5-hydroxy-6-metoxy-1,4-benzoquinol methylase